MREQTWVLRLQINRLDNDGRRDEYRGELSLCLFLFYKEEGEGGNTMSLVGSARHLN